MKLDNSKKLFVSGDEAVALGVRLARPHVISAYPITPQTIVVERLSEMTEDKSLDADFMHVESEHSALSAAMGVSAVGARAFTATSSQGLLYMAEVMSYCSGGRYPVVMMNANRALALPWSIFGDQSDSLLLLGSGWIQVYVEDAQEALDMMIQAYKIAENPKVLTPFMVNLDGFVLTHTYELVDIPEQKDVDEFLPPFETPNKMSLEEPKGLGFSTSPADNLEFKFQQHQAMIDALPLLEEVDQAFGDKFGRYYGGALETYETDDADHIMITVGSITGTTRVVVDTLRKEGKKVGLIKLRYLRPMPEVALVEAIGDAKSIGILDKDISFGHEGTIFTNVNSALAKENVVIKKHNFICGMGGRNISKQDIITMYQNLEDSVSGKSVPDVQFINLNTSVR
ncbi:MAG: pyruvate ferredoxin oxidoreductase [Candidatus Cloacimonetes bacterium 4572_65]|nr:MAG: pyruvate ferredoxin oxidoreductase [Candidatus Cloacimonetes bacterium 4572_65]